MVTENNFLTNEGYNRREWIPINVDPIEPTPMSRKRLHQPRLEVTRQAPAHKDPLEPKLMKVKKTLIQLTDEEFLELGLEGSRHAIAVFLRAKYYTILEILMILAYTLLIVVYLSFDTDVTGRQLLTLYCVEIALLCVFIVDIAMQGFAYRALYLRDFWSIVDCLVIMLMLVFVLLDIFTTNQALHGFLKFRAIFRILRVFLLVRKLNALRKIGESSIHRNRVHPFSHTAPYDMNRPLD